MRIVCGRGLRDVCVVLAVSAGLAGCGGGGGDDEPPPPAVTAGADSFTLDIGQSAQLLANDRIASATATAGTGGNVSFSLTSGTLPVGVSVTEGTVTVGAGAVPGTVNLAYRICQAGSTTNCATASGVITIPAPLIVAAADSFTLPAGSSGDVLANDTLGGTPATPTRVTVTTTTALPTGVSFAPAGVLTVGTAAAAGSYPIGYRICQTVAPTNCANATATVTVPALASASGRAVDATNGQGVANVRVTIGSRSTTTDATGAFTLAGVAASERATVVFESSTHAETARVVALGTSGSTDIQARLVRVGVATDVAVAAGGTVTVPSSTARVVLPASAVQRANGSIPTGNMTVRVTPINPAVDSSTMPGDFTTLVAGAPASIDSFGALGVTLRDAAGEALNLRPGSTSTIRIPLGSRSANPPATIPLFYFDNATGRWIQEGSATLVGSGATAYYEGTVTHFSTWNADRVSETVRVTGCVADVAGARIANAQVGSDGVDYSGTSSAVSVAGGSFTIAIRRNSQATLVALSAGTLTNTVRVGPFSSDTVLTDCLALGSAGAGVTMKLTWGAAPSDLDSYLYLPSGTRVYYSNKGSLLAAPYTNLDVDDTSSYGPEVITVTRLMVGTYKYAINNYSGQGSGFIGQSGARVELNIPGRPAELFVPPIGTESASTNWWLLFELDVDAQCNVVVRRLPAFSNSSPTAAASSTPVYCQRP